MQQRWRDYQQTIFLSHQPFCSQASFAVISVANPKGEISNQGLTYCLDKAFAAELEQSPYRFRRILGASPCLQFKEASWAVFCSQQQAEAMAFRWQLNAIFWIERGQLWFIPIVLTDQVVELGDFQRRLSLY